MINNNSGGEKSLEFGKTDKYVPSLSFICRRRRARSKATQQKRARCQNEAKDFEGKVYRDMFELVTKTTILCRLLSQKSEDSTGYHLWNVWDKENEIFDLGKAIIGAKRYTWFCHGS